MKFALGLIIACFCFAGLCALFYKAGKEYGRVEGYDKAMEDIKKKITNSLGLPKPLVDMAQHERKAEDRDWRHMKGV